jgi:hypothetical protein
MERFTADEEIQIINQNLFVLNDPLKLYEAIGKASVKFDAIPKKQQGQIGHQKFKYASYHVIRTCILKHLVEQGVTMMQPLHYVEGQAAISLIISGHGAAITSRFIFPIADNVQEFGRVSTYFRRYQLQAFFCLEGDVDADDPEDLVVEPKNFVAKKEDSRPPQSVVGQKIDKKAATIVQSSSTINKGEAKDASKEKGSTGNNGEAKPNVAMSVGDKLMSAKAQLNWQMADFDSFCQEHIDQFPNFTKAMNLPKEQKQILVDLLVKHKNVAPF